VIFPKIISIGHQKLVELIRLQSIFEWSIPCEHDKEDDCSCKKINVLIILFISKHHFWTQISLRTNLLIKLAEAIFFIKRFCKTEICKFKLKVFSKENVFWF
jgi:hypothetical protein